MKKTRIIGGISAGTTDFQYLVSLQDYYSHFCVGSLIAPDVILTAAHCLGGSYKVIAGQSNLSSDNGQVMVKLKEMTHPEYDAYSSNNDFGLIFLTKEVSNAQVSKLNQDNSYPSVGASVTVAGWGDTAQSEMATKASDELMRVNVNVISNVDCEDSSDGRGIDYFGQITDNMLCAKVRGGGKDACQGDSGGPLSVTNNDVHVQVGIVSWGIGCARDEFPGVYSRISKAYSWIQNEVCENSINPPTSFGCASGGLGGGSGSSSSGVTGGSDVWTPLFVTEFTNGLGPFLTAGTDVLRLEVDADEVLNLQFTGKIISKEFVVQSYTKCQTVVNFKMVRMAPSEEWCVEYSSNKGQSYKTAKCFESGDYTSGIWYYGQKAQFLVENMDNIHIRLRCNANTRRDDVYIRRAKLECQ